MATRKRKCCVPGCTDEISKRHRFSKDPGLLHIWLENIKNPALIGKTPKQLSENYRVCHRHFPKEFENPGFQRELIPCAYPTLFLPGTIIAECTEATPSLPNLSPLTPPLMNMETPSTSHLSQTTTPTSAKRRSILREFNVTRRKQLPQHQRQLYHKVVAWSRKATKLSRKMESLTERLKQAETCADSLNMQNLMKHVNDSTYSFILSQIKNQKYDPRGRRFSLEDKILALSLFKSSGRGYKLLSKIFALPSRQSLTKILAQMPLVSKKMFEALKTSTEKLEDMDKVCVLMFDEMSLQVNVQYNAKSDILEGISTAGTRTPELANHVTVFLLRGVHKQWKQPLCYQFSSGPIKTVVLKNLLKEVTEECISTGFNVVATVCDQYLPIISA